MMQEFYWMRTKPEVSYTALKHYQELTVENSITD
jgi:hypothetical protein